MLFTEFIPLFYRFKERIFKLGTLAAQDTNGFQQKGVNDRKISIVVILRRGLSLRQL